MKIFNRDQKTGRILTGYTILSKQQRDSKFWSCVEMIPFHSCWEWMGSIDGKGYGRFHIGNHKYAKAHRYALSLTQDLHPQLVVDHICRNRSCVNPNHLRQVTKTVNSLENSIGTGAINKKKTHCKYGHIFDAQNTGYNLYGNRWCKACNKNRCKK